MPALPAHTAALCYRRYGDESCLDWENIPLMPPARGQVLVRIGAVSVNPVDWKILAGEQKLFTGRSLRAPRGFGGDFAGTVEVVGPGVRGMEVGTRVCGLLNPLARGSFSQWLVVPCSACVPLPDSISLETGAALPAAGIAAIRAFRKRSSTWWAGKRVFLNGAAGGVGHLLLQLLAHADALVWASASHERLADLEKLGASVAVNYHDGLVPARRAAFDAVIDCHGSLARAPTGELFAGKPGLFIPLSIANSQIPAVLGRAAWAALSGGPDIRVVLAAPSHGLLAQLVGRCAAGSLTPRIAARFPAERAREAVALSRTGHVFGKIIVTLD